MMEHSQQTPLALLRDAQDETYRAFTAKLIPNVPPETILGVRVPAIRAMSRELRGSEAAAAFLCELPHKWHEENLLHAFLIGHERDFDRAMRMTETFLPCIDNWAVCDSFFPAVFRRYPDALLEKIRIWLDAEHPYTVRFALGALMRVYLDDNFRPEYLALAASVRREEYYINMMQAWYFATALAKQPEAAEPYLRERRLSPWVHARTIQKAVESYRVSDELKTRLRSYRAACSP